MVRKWLIRLAILSVTLATLLVSSYNYTWPPSP